MKSNIKQSSSEFVIDKYFRYYWIIIPLLTLIYYIFSKYSTGFYQDDEVAHFINSRDFWQDPFIILSNWGKPGWKILIVLPSLLGYDFLQLFNSLISALTVYFTILLANNLGLKNSLAAGIFLGFQPHLLQLAFRSYAEIFTGLILVLSLLFYFRNKFTLSAIFCGLAFTIRQETALLCIILAIYMFLNKQFKAIPFIGLFPLIVNLFGYLKTGDIIWIWSEMQSLGEFNLGIERSFFHYFEVYIFIIGPVVFAFFVSGLFYPFTLDSKHKKSFFNKEFLIYIFLAVVFLFQCYLVAKGTNPGSWRYLLQVSPLAAIIALIGFNMLFDTEKRKYALTALSFAAILTLLFFSKESTGLLLTDKNEYMKFFVITTLAIYFIFASLSAKSLNLLHSLVLVVILTIGYTFYTEKPKPQGEENITVSKIADWYTQNIDRSKPVLYNHSLVLFYAKIFGKDKENFKILNSKTLSESPAGTIIIWDSHYSYRPEYKNDVRLEVLQNKDQFRLLNQFVSKDKRFIAYIFEKL
ncbi:MAG: hypothetical protein N2510_04585 [Ignavibacteria bacterium]|nr:hypothetical protein [Ignavibacteria bacterium]